MTQPTAQDIIAHFNMSPLPGEGGHFVETYRSKGRIPHAALPERFPGERNVCTDIYFVLARGEKSLLHRIKADEIWHFYAGGPLVIVQISPAGEVSEITLGPDFMNGHTLQHVVPHGYWFGSYPAEGTEYALVGCTVAPGFEFEDFELGERAALLEEFPAAREQILHLTPDA